VTEKLNRRNFAMWHAQVESAIRGAHLDLFIKPSSKPPAEFLQIDDKTDKAGKPVDLLPNPEYED
jgi:hypothetical protein